METLHAFDRHCYDDVCHCDFRLSIYDCVESDIGRITNIINIALSSLLIITGCILIYNRIFIKGYTFIDTSSKKGILRPKPIDCMLLFVTIFNFIRLACSIILIIDAAPNNMALRSFMWEGAFQWGLCGFTLYIIGISQALAESHRSISDSWMPSPFVVDAIGLSTIITSIVVNCILSVSSGAISSYNMRVAEILLTVNYILWTILTAGVSTSVIYFGSRLLLILNRQLKITQAGSERHRKLKAGILRIRLNMALMSGCLLSFTATVCIFGAIRNQVLKNFTGNAILCVLWNMLGSSTTLFIEGLIIFNPKSTAQSKGIKLNSSGEQSSHFLDSQNNSKGNGDMTFQDTLTHGTLDNINIKYEEMLNRSIQKHDAGSGSPSDTNYFVKKQRDLNKKSKKFFEINRNGSRIVYTKGNHE